MKYIYKKIIIAINELLFKFNILLERHKKFIIISIVMANLLIISFIKVHLFIVILMIACSWLLLFLWSQESRGKG